MSLEQQVQQAQQTQQGTPQRAHSPTRAEHAQHGRHQGLEGEGGAWDPQTHALHEAHERLRARHAALKQRYARQGMRQQALQQLLLAVTGDDTAPAPTSPAQSPSQPLATHPALKPVTSVLSLAHGFPPAASADLAAHPYTSSPGNHAPTVQTVSTATQQALFGCRGTAGEPIWAEGGSVTTTFIKKPLHAVWQSPPPPAPPLGVPFPIFQPSQLSQLPQQPLSSRQLRATVASQEAAPLHGSELLGGLTVGSTAARAPRAPVPNRSQPPSIAEAEAIFAFAARGGGAATAASNAAYSLHPLRSYPPPHTVPVTVHAAHAAPMLSASTGRYQEQLAQLPPSTALNRSQPPSPTAPNPFLPPTALTQSQQQRLWREQYPVQRAMLWQQSSKHYQVRLLDFIYSYVIGTDPVSL